jgi:hypothetical protein
MPKKGKRDKIQPVIPMDQIAIDENGNAVAKSVRPLTYALMTFIKCDLGMEDTIDISDDESEAQWQVSFSSEDSKHSFSAFIDTDENSGIIALNIYLDGHKFDLDENGGLPFIRFILDENLRLLTGQLQVVNGFLRFHSSIDVEGVASEDPNYHGPHLISPRLIANLFGYGKAAFEMIVARFLSLAEPHP